MKKLILGGVGLIMGLIVVAVVLVTVVAVLLETNPPVVKEPNWDSPQTRALAVRACFDCHSNETRWPWFTRLPFGSWLAVTDTLRGRSALNFSTWGQPTSGEAEGHSLREIQRVIERGSMPPGTYLMMHLEAVLTDAEKQQLINGLNASLQ